MTESASTGASTRARIVRAAVALTRERGLDGWTMDDLAAVAGVSRRTLFNHVPGKVDAVIGEIPTMPPAELAVFRAGGPTGALLDDVGVMVRALLASDQIDVDQQLARTRTELLVANPRLLAVAHERFEQVSVELGEHLLARHADWGPDRARLLVRLVVALFDTAVERLAAGPADADLADLFDAALADARGLLDPDRTPAPAPAPAAPPAPEDS